MEGSVSGQGAAMWPAFDPLRSPSPFMAAVHDRRTHSFLTPERPRANSGSETPSTAQSVGAGLEPRTLSLASALCTPEQPRRGAPLALDAALKGSAAVDAAVLAATAPDAPGMHTLVLTK